MNNTTVSGIKLKVSISRNQPIEFGDKGVTAWNAIGKHFIYNLMNLYTYYIYILLTLLLPDYFLYFFYLPFIDY